MILIVNKNRKLASGVCDMLYFMGVLSYPATPEEAIVELSPLYSATLLINPLEIYDEPELTETLRALSDAPVFCHGESAFSCIYDESFSTEKSSAEVLSGITRYCEERGMKIPFTGMHISKSEEEANLYSLLTRTEKMILKLLKLSRDEGVSASEILKYSFRSSRQPDIASIRTHISIINKKATKNLGRKIIFVNESNKYCLCESKEGLKIQSK